MHLRSDSSSGHPFVFDLQKKSFTDNSDELFVWIFRCRSPGSSHLGLEVLFFRFDDSIELQTSLTDFFKRLLERSVGEICYMKTAKIETLKLDKPHDDALIIQLDIGRFQLSSLLLTPRVRLKSFSTRCSRTWKRLSPNLYHRKSSNSPPSAGSYFYLLEHFY
ncbi:hypothetical protein F2Q70_00035937 [Brassica cretica]|uniref:Uncharacterized protein n=1 Tax=Brassica cretica TaxID=69181 RepID=A0A8S9JVF6_BRACR|nr:hypothetical protein F2Q70_00035937 [Brassica cretica]